MLFDRTFHPDEANQAFTVGRLLETGRYSYKPTDHHGPTLYYAAAPLQRAFGHNATADLDGTLLRCTPLVFGVAALVFGALAIRRLMVKDGFPRAASWLVPALFALTLGTSPLFAFFATDFIQETLLASFFMMAAWTGTEYFSASQCVQRMIKPGTWALLFGTACGLMFATKETCVLSFAAAGLASAPFLWRNRRNLRIEPRDVVLAAAGFLLTSILFFSSFASDWTGVYNAFIAAPISYLRRAAGDAASDGAAWHVHPWWQYLRWMFGSGVFSSSGEAAFLLAMLAPAMILLRRGAASRAGHLAGAFAGAFLYTVILAVLYSAIPYKTPWCAVQILAGLELALFLAAALFMRLSPPRLKPTIPILLASAAILSVHGLGLVRMWRAPDSPSIPYNYAHASPEVKQLSAVAADAIRAAELQPRGEGRQAPFIAVALPPTDTWPFPWYNRALEAKTGYWTKFEDLVALEKSGVRPAVVIVPMTEGHLAQALFPHLKNTKRFYIRPGVRVRVFW